jgi:Protein of unknown function (DUF1559)
MSDSAGRRRLFAVLAMFLSGVIVLVLVIGLGAIFVLQAGRMSHRAECANNLRRLGVGLGRFHDHHDKTFPPAAMPAPGLAPEERLSWIAGVFPFLGEGKSTRFIDELAPKIDLEHSWRSDQNAAIRSMPMRMFVCPDDPRFPPREAPSHTNYVGLSGLGVDAIRLPRNSPDAGAFGYDAGVAPADTNPSTSFTLFVVETASPTGPWLAGGSPTVRGVDPALTEYIGPGRPFGGLHPNGMNALRGDLSVQWMSDRIDAPVFRRQVPLRREE